MQAAQPCNMSYLVVCPRREIVILDIGRKASLHAPGCLPGNMAAADAGGLPHASCRKREQAMRSGEPKSHNAFIRDHQRSMVREWCEYGFLASLAPLRPAASAAADTQIEWRPLGPHGNRCTSPIPGHMQVDGSPAPKLLAQHLNSAEPVEGGFQLGGLPAFDRVWVQASS